MENSSTEEGWELFLTLTEKIRSAKERNALFSLFLTHEERETLASRTLILKELLDKKRTQREISAHCNVSIAQITRGSNALKSLDPAIKKRLEEILLSD